MSMKKILLAASAVLAMSASLATPSAASVDDSQYLDGFTTAELMRGVGHLYSAPILEFKDGEDVETKTVAEQAAEIKAALDKSVDSVKELAEKAVGMAEKNEKAAAGQTEKVDDAIKGMNELKTAFDAFEQKLARGEGEQKTSQTPGQAFVGSDEYKALIDGTVTQGRVAAVQMKAITSLTTDADGSAGDLVRTERVQSAMPTLPERRMTVRDLVAPGQTNSNGIEYVQETGFTNAAAMVAEGTLKPESSLKFDLMTAPVRKIAHWMLASSEILADAPGLQSMIDQRLRYGLAYKEEAQMLNGDGTGQNLLGIRPQATDFAAPFTITDATPIDLIRLAILQAVLAEYPASGIVLNPIDWARIETTKDADGRYIIGNPQGTASPTLWSLPVVATQAMEVDKFLTGAFRQGAQVFDRMQATVMASTEDSDNFRKNLVTILAEERLAFTCYRPEAFIEGDFGNVA